MGENTKTSDRMVVKSDDEPKESLYNELSSYLQAASSAISKVASNLTLESSTTASSPTNLTIGGMITAADTGNAGTAKALGPGKVEHEGTTQLLNGSAKAMTETLSKVFSREAAVLRDQLPEGWPIPKYETLPWPKPGMEKHILNLSNPDLVANSIAKDQEVGKAAFDKIQNFLKENKREDAQKYVDEINKELQQQKPPSKYELQMKDYEYAGHGGVGREKWYPGSKGIELSLVDKTKTEQENKSADTPNWTLTKEKTGFFKVDPEKPSEVKFPPHEKFESWTKKTERENDEAATDMAKKLSETKDLKSIEKLLEKRWDIGEMVKRINDKLQKPLSLSVETPQPDKDGLIAARFGSEYQLDLKENGKSIQKHTIFRIREPINYIEYNTGKFDK